MVIIMHFQVSCAHCDRTVPIRSRDIKCPFCGGIFLIKVKELQGKGFDSLVDRKSRGVWRYSKMLPFSEEPVSLGEGGTPIVGKQEDGAELLFKLEYCSPTGSFKDRGASVSLTRVKAIGARGIVEDSSGNAGIAASAYSAKAGLKARVYVPSDAPADKKTLIKACGAEVVETSSRSEASSRAAGELRDEEVYIGHTQDPFYIEGMKTIAFETYEGGYKPETVVVPVASGTILIGIHKGFLELQEMGLVDKIPAIFGVQGVGCAPIYEAIHGKLQSRGTSYLADGLRIEDPPRRREIVNAILASGGDIFTVTDEEIASAVMELYGMGIIAEPTSATVLAAYRKHENVLKGRILMPLTGSGMKTAENLARILRF
jgi:threonine synthase